MQRLFVIVVAIALAACAPLTQPAAVDQETPSSALPIDTATGELDITPEPFVDPLVPVSLTGAVTVRERALSGGILEIGDPRARTTMEIYLNPESPYAREFQQSRMPLLLIEFIEPGLLKAHVLILPIRKYAGSDESARTIACAAQQQKGYPALDRIFAAGVTALTQDDVTELDLDGMLFLNCMQTLRIDLPATDITLVPSYRIGGDTFVGLPTEADLLGAVRAAL